MLESKGHLRHQSRGHRYAYLPAVPASATRRRALKEMVSTFFQGSTKQAVVALLDETAKNLSSTDLDEIRRHIDEAGQQGR